MPVSPTGILSLPLDTMADLIAGCSSFQTWTSTVTAAAAKAFVYQVAIIDSSYTRPGVRIAWKSAKVMRGGNVAGVITACWEAVVASGDQAVHTDAAFRFMNNIGAILAEMMTDQEDNSAMPFIPSDGIVMGNGFARSGPKESTDYCQLYTDIPWGIPKIG